MARTDHDDLVTDLCERIRICAHIAKHGDKAEAEAATKRAEEYVRRLEELLS